MSENVIYPVFRDEVAESYRAVRDATLCNESMSAAEKVAVLELVKAELMRNMVDALDAES